MWQSKHTMAQNDKMSKELEKQPVGGGGGDGGGAEEAEEW